MHYDPTFRRINYVRYADDFLIGIIDPKSETIEIIDKIYARKKLN